MHISGAWAKALTSGRLNGRGGLSGQTVRHHHRVLKQALKQAVVWRLLTINPASDIKAPKVHRKEMTILNPEQTRELIEAFKPTKLYMPVLIAASTGMRRSEILGLRWRDVNLDAADLKVTQVIEQTRSGLRFHPPKTTSSLRTIALPALLIEVLRRHKANQAREHLALGLRRDANRLVISNPDGSPMPPEYLTREFGRQFTFINERRTSLGQEPLPRIRFHDLRHTHISLLLIAKEHPNVVSARAGHASVSITLGIYGHLLPGMQEGAASRINELLGTAAER